MIKTIDGFYSKYFISSVETIFASFESIQVILF